MKLKTGTSYWSTINRRTPAYPRLRSNLACDVAIIGAGISGALAAHQLVQAGFKVVIVDRRAPGTGSTSASTSMLLYETDTLLAELARLHGRKAALRVYELGRRAIGELGRIARLRGINCRFQPKKSLCLASDAAGLTQLKGEYRLRRRTGLRGTLLTRRQLRARFGLDFPGALYSPGCAAVDALHLTQALLARYVRSGRLRVFQKVRICRLRAATDGVRLQTTSCRTIRAKHVIVATGYEAAPFLEAGLVKLHSTYVIASQPVPVARLWKDECLMWETARPYFYLRTTADHRILMGGEDEPFADPARRDARLPAKCRKLLRRCREILPGIPFEVTHAWAGTFAETRDGLPYIGAKSGSPRVLYALGYGGNGITFSQIAASLLCRICQGEKPRDARLFRFNRTYRVPPGRVGGSR